MATTQAIKISDFDYDLPDNRIAKYQLQNRGESKLLVYKNEEIKDDTFQKLPVFLPENSLLVFNNTRVIPARLYFRRATGAVIELFLLKPVSPSAEITLAMSTSESSVWECMIGNKKKWKGEVLELNVSRFQSSVGSFQSMGSSGVFDFALRAELVDSEKNLVKFSWERDYSFAEVIKAAGEMPLPPYLNRETEERDLENYQTVYSKIDGAVAAPTAGLHFTDEMLEVLKSKHKLAHITLHVGAGTFQPVKTENALEHEMHKEEISFSRAFLKQLHDHKGSVIAVGTTSARSLESLYWFGVKLLENPDSQFEIEQMYPYGFEQTKLPDLNQSIAAILNKMENENLEKISGHTGIMIFPGYKFKVCEGIITNFHQPKSTLLLLISALIGDNWRKAYQFALNNDFRFLSYGDSSLLLP